MRVRTNRTSETRHRGGPSRRRAVARREEPVSAATEPEPDRAAGGRDDELFDERRLRASGGPNDRVQYTCGCGFVWAADVSASVACPQCGASQAW
jgi:rubrerythrin